MRLWYVRRGVSWTPLLACSLLALIAAGTGRAWPGSLTVLQPVALACCAAAAAFLFDEPATQVVAVTPRGAWWRRSSRLAVLSLPVVVWLLTIALLPRGVVVDRGAWALAGCACIVVAAGAAGWCARRELAAPGSSLASAVAGLVLLPVVVSPIAGWEPVLRQGAFPGWAVGFWCGVAAVGLALTAWSVRPGLR